MLMDRGSGEAWEAAVQAAEALEPEAGMLALLDPLSFGQTLARVFTSAIRHPAAVVEVSARGTSDLAGAGRTALSRILGRLPPGPVPLAAKDRRFKDAAWDENPFFFAALQVYLLWSRAVSELIDELDLDPRSAEKARFATRMIIDAVAPTNYIWSNPAALKRIVDTGGVSVVLGLRNFLNDLATNGGLPRQVDQAAFTVGENLAATPGKVVFRNDLMELIQYAPQTETTFEIPLLLSPPWINKYYIMDLSPGRSFVEWAVAHGHTVFAISYRNADESMRGVGLDDYLLGGPRTALDVVADVTGKSQVNVVGLCVGGTLTMMLLAYLSALGEERVRSATLLNTLVDFSEPGVLGCFTDVETIGRLEKKMALRGYLDAADMRRTFDLLRANDLIWSYVASSWLMGESPPVFDILAWNSDATRMPANLHSFYLRSCYVDNLLATGQMELAGTSLRLEDVSEDVYILAAKEDHIVPWRSSYKTTGLHQGTVRFVLTSSGHIAGIVNPPGPKSRHWVNDQLPKDPDTWLAGAAERPGSWWEDWTGWVAERAGARGRPPPMGCETYPPLADAPGSYVFG